MKLGKESEKLEFKKTTGELKEGVISLAAILNKHGGGELYFGIRNDGVVLGQMVSEKTLREISQAVSNSVEPKIYPQITEVTIDDKQCVHVAFSGEDAPYFAYGRAYIRVADEDKLLSAAELESLFLKKNASRDLWDEELSGKTAADVSEDILREYIERANRAGRIDFTYTTRDEVLNRLAVTTDGKLKNAADALFCGSSMLEMQMAIFAGTERLTFNDIKRESGSVISLVETAEKYIRNNIRWRVVLDGSLQRKEIPEIPTDAIREALINSYCHRDYRSSQNNEITIYSNRVEIYNPGTFPEGMTPQDFIKKRERSVKRNPFLAQLMYYTKDIESFGTGLLRITTACEEAGIKVEFQLLKKGFAVVFYRPDARFETGDVSNNVPKNFPKNVPLNEIEKLIISSISQNPKVTQEQLATVISKSRKTVQRYLSGLRDKNVVKYVGPKNGGHWEIVQDAGE